MTRIGGLTGSITWLSCPRDATGYPNSVAEWSNDLETVPSEQKYCCGQSYNRYCCDYAQKVAEDPNFDEAGVESDSEEIYVLGSQTHQTSGIFGEINECYIIILSNSWRLFN